MFPGQDPLGPAAEHREGPTLGAIEPAVFPEQTAKHFARRSDEPIAPARPAALKHALLGLQRGVTLHLAAKGRQVGNRRVVEMGRHGATRADALVQLVDRADPCTLAATHKPRRSVVLRAAKTKATTKNRAANGDAEGVFAGRC